DVCTNSLLRKALEEGQMFESCGVEDDVGPRFADKGFDERGIPEVSKDEVVTGQQRRTFKPEFRGVQSGLVAVGHDEPGGVEPRHLAAQLRSDGATRTCDEDAFPGYSGGDVIDIGRDRLTADEIFKADIAEAPMPKIGDIDRVRLRSRVIGVRELRHALDLDRTRLEAQRDLRKLFGRQISDGDDHYSGTGAV